MLTKARVERFYADLEALGLKYPVAAVSKATGYSKGNVSEWISRKKEPSENFIDKFYTEFYKGSFPVKKIEDNTENVGYINRNPLPGAATLYDLLSEKEQRIAEAKAFAEKMEQHYKDAMERLKHEQNNVAHAQDTIRKTLTSLESNLKTGQHQIKEQLFVVGESLAQQLEGISSGLAALGKDREGIEKDTSVAGQQPNNDGKGKNRK